ncbi:MAG: YihY/virulence factor BrkB family protein, partial [Gammaproteobacteria bacterium]|nr:YihY/virulence factor BrkB family protein [Gammaproteobacteria bacterium]
MWDIVRQRIEEILWSPQSNSSNILIRTALRWMRFPYALVRDAVRGELTLRAMSLVFTTLLAIVPLIAFSFSVLKAFGIHRQVQPLLYSFLQPLGAEGVELTDQIIGFVDNTRGVALGSVGLALLIFSVISMVQKIEEAFNFVWQVQRTRSLGRRFSEYLSVIIIAPVLMATALGLKGTVENTAFAKWLLNLPAISETVIILGFFMPYMLVILTFSFIYGLIPNTTVSLRAALLGGLVGGTTWSLVGAAFASFVGASTRYEAIYSGFAIPLFALIWLYISWLVVLLGARVSYYYQNPEYLRRGHKYIELTNRLRERLALALMYLVGKEFRHERPHWTTNSLAKHLGMPA